VRKVKEVRARLERSGLLPSSEPQTPSATVTAALNESTAASSLGAAAQHLQRFQEATRGPSLDRPGMIDALQRLTAALEQPEAGLSADQYRSIIGTLLATNALAHTDAQDNPLLLLMEEIKTAAKPVPPKIADLNQAAGDLYSELGGLPRPLGPGKVDELVKALRNARAFDWLAKICDRLIATGQATNLVHRFYAQALVDSGHIKAGMNVLEELKRQPLPKTDLDEVMGQIGRANKQIYVDHIRTSADAAAAGQRYAPYLREAVRHYSEVFDANRAGDTSWPGINMVALAQRARADGIRLEPAIDPETIARRIIADLEAKDAAGKIEEWDVATLGEAHLALGDFDRAATYYQRYASDKGQNYFKLGSTVRQLEEVWRAGNGGEGIRKCVFALKAALVEQPVAEFGLTAAERRTIRNPQFETSYRDGEFLKYRKLRDIVRAGECIAWIKNGPYAEQGLGTGFLIVGSQLAPVLGSDLYLLTNTHVVCDARIDIRWRDKGSLTPDEAYVQFEAADENADGGGVPRSYRLVRDAVWLSPSSEYDACLLRLTEQPDRVSPARLAASTDAVSFGNEDDDRDGTPVAVLGHAGGRELQIGVRGTLLNHQGNVVDRGPRTREEHPPVYLHYDSPTLGGNSGSPVYDMRTWQVIGLHHAGYDEYEGRARLRGRGGRHNANEGIDIRSIGDAIQRDLSGGGSFWSRFGRRSR
jgi:tetratricopeptide (TPR) repeat protein